jgi:diguanylate cyclase (GGDEF)-like protein/PAS domain S-box-containing protein
MLEVGVAAVLLYRYISPTPDLTQRRQLTSLLIYGVILAPAVASLCAQLTAARTPWLPLFNSFRYWFTADALGIATMTPLYLSFNKRPVRSWTETLGLLGLLTAMTFFVFSREGTPCLFLLMPLLLLLGVRLRLAGSALGLLIVSIIGGFYTVSGHGPIMLIRSSSPYVRDLALQFFIAVCMLTLYSVELVIANRERLEISLKSSETRFRLLAEASSDVIVLAGLDGKRRYISPAVTFLLGWEPEDLLGQTYRHLVHPEDASGVSVEMEACRDGMPVEAFPFRWRKKDGSYLWMEASLRLHRDTATGEPIGLVKVVRDISVRKAAEEELNRAFRIVENQAMIDGLTGVANRRRFDETMEQEWRRAMRDRSPLSLLMIDVDHFKGYNDIYGHIAGDSCLREIVAAIQEVLHRAADLLARYGGEEFVVVLPFTDSGGAQLVAEQIRSAVERRHLQHSGNSYGIVTVSIGCATQTMAHDSEKDSLLQAADIALYHAKSAGRNRTEAATALSVEK